MKRVTSLPQQLREKIKEQRQALSVDEHAERSRLLCQHVWQAIQKINPKSYVALFRSFKGEPDLSQLEQSLMQAKLPLVYSRVSREDMAFYQVKDPDHYKWEISNFGIEEPQAGLVIAPQDIQVIIVPGLVFDKQGNRLGFGRGYYDRYLSQCPEATKIGIAFDFQVIDEGLQPQPWDVPMNWIATDKTITQV